MGKLLVLIVQLFFCVTLPFISHCGATISVWLSVDGVNKGLFNEFSMDGSVHRKVLDPGVLAIHLVANILLFEMTMNSYMLVIGNYLVMKIFQRRSYSEQDHTKFCRINRLCFKINLFLYFPISCLILTECIVFSNKHPMELIGPGFYLSLAACLFMWLSILVFIFDQLCKEKTENNVFHSLLSLKNEFS